MAGPFENRTAFEQITFTNATYNNLHVHTSQSAEPKYYVETSTFKPGKPDLTVHSGNAKTGPIIGVCKIGHTFEKMIGLGDPSGDINSVQWETLKQHGLFGGLTFKFEFEYDTEGDRKSFTWTRISRYPEHYKLVMDGRESEPLAEYSGTWLGKFGKGRERGKLAVIKGKGERWELAVLLTAVTMIETTKRRTRRSM